MVHKRIKKLKTNNQPSVEQHQLQSNTGDSVLVKVCNIDFGFTRLADSATSLQAFKKTGLTDNVYKYYLNRYNFFDLYDEGIKLDSESWFSVTPQLIAEFLAGQLRGVNSIADLCCGSGGNTIRVSLVVRTVHTFSLRKRLR